MYCFKNDYSEGAHPRILQILTDISLVQSEGYGEDVTSKKAIELIKQRIGKEHVDIHLLTGGTQTNLIAISAFLRPHEAAIAASTGHIFVHETGAIEATGHKVFSIDAKDGKLTPEHVEYALKIHTDEHMVKPKLVYISNPTEIGTIYTKKELENLSEICKANHLLFYMDGARLGSALACEENDVTLSDLANLTDTFYIGGTKNGALLGEALVLCTDFLKEDFRYHIKQKGAMLAKGSLLGAQFLALFQDDLYFELAAHANRLANMIKDEIKNEGYSFLTNSPTNQLFPILPKGMIAKLLEKYSFLIWEEIDENYSAIRLVTSWATKEEYVTAFIQDLKEYSKKGTV